MDPSRPITDREAASPHSNSWARIIFSSERKEGRGGKDRRGSREDTDAALRARSLACRALFGYQGVSSPPTLAAIPLSFRSLFSSLNAPVVLSIEPIVCPPNTFNDLNPTQRSAMSAALRVLSAWPCHATRTMRTGLTRYDVSTTISTNHYFRFRSERVVQVSFFNLLRGWARVMIDREKREPRLWLNFFFWLNYFIRLELGY